MAAVAGADGPRARRAGRAGGGVHRAAVASGARRPNCWVRCSPTGRSTTWRRWAWRWSLYLAIEARARRDYRPPRSASRAMFTTWCLISGVLLIVIGLSDTWRQNLPFSTSAIYLVAGYLLGPEVSGLMSLQLGSDAVLLERMTEVAVLISLFAVGLRLRVNLSRSAVARAAAAGHAGHGADRGRHVGLRPGARPGLGCGDAAGRGAGADRSGAGLGRAGRARAGPRPPALQPHGRGRPERRRRLPLRDAGARPAGPAHAGAA